MKALAKIVGSFPIEELLLQRNSCRFSKSIQQQQHQRILSTNLQKRYSSYFSTGNYSQTKSIGGTRTKYTDTRFGCPCQQQQQEHNVIFTRNNSTTTTTNTTNTTDTTAAAAAAAASTTTTSNSEQRSIPSSSSPFARITDVTELAQEIRSEVRTYTRQQRQRQRQRQRQQISSSSSPLKLVGIFAHKGPFRSDAKNYSQHIAETCAQDGIEYELHRVMGETPQHVERAIQEQNARSDVHGILVYYPIFKFPEAKRGPFKNSLTGVYYKTHDDYLRDLVCPTKDVEGLCQDYNARWLFRQRKKEQSTKKNDNHVTNNDEAKQHETMTPQNVVYPCTALSVLHILERYAKQSTQTWHPQQQQDFPNHHSSKEGIVVTIINRSEIFGRPLAAMLAQRGATVYSVDEHSILMFRQGGRVKRIGGEHKNLEWCLEQSSMIVTGVPSPNFLVPCESIQPGTTVVNVSEFPNVDEESLLEIPDIQYIPHVGKVTVAIMENNLVELHKRFHSH